MKTGDGLEDQHDQDARESSNHQSDLEDNKKSGPQVGLTTRDFFESGHFGFLGDNFQKTDGVCTEKRLFAYHVCTRADAHSFSARFVHLAESHFITCHTMRGSRLKCCKAPVHLCLTKDFISTA